MNELKNHIEQIKVLCGKYGVKSIFAFGSVLSDNLKPDNDIDLIVDIESKDPLDYSDNYFNLKAQLEGIFNRPVGFIRR